LPTELTTPPVKKIYFVVIWSSNKTVIYFSTKEVGRPGCPSPPHGVS
jgi:hypothetical protein